MTPKEAIRLIEDYEGKNIWEIWEDSHIENREYGYIIKPTTTKTFPTKVIKIIGTSKRIKSPELLALGNKDIFFHTHPHQLRARLSSTDVVSMLYYPVKGMGVIAGDEVKCWELPKDIADHLFVERQNIIKEWREAYLRDDVGACYHYRAKLGANTRKIRKAIKLVYAINRHSNIDSNLLGITILAGAILFLWLVRRKKYSQRRIYYYG